MSERSKGARLVALSLGGLVVFNYPFLAIVDSDGLVGGVPLLWGYLFTVWAVFIALTAWLVRR